jgi:hypothetical protein
VERNFTPWPLQKSMKSVGGKSGERHRRRSTLFPPAWRAHVLELEYTNDVRIRIVQLLPGQAKAGKI